MSDEPHELVLARTLDAPRDKLWRCWTEPELLKRWFCPAPWHVSEARIDLRPGGEFYTLMNGPDGERMGEPGVFLEVVEPRRLVFTDAFAPGWRPSGRPFMVAEVLLEDTGDGRTRYTARVMHWTAAARKEHEEMGFHDGWGRATDQLEALARAL
ncbi:MAG: SRPBCC family protein [Pseudomonadota bacterium]